MMNQDRLIAPEVEEPSQLNRAAHILDRLSSAVYTTDKSGVITYFNAAAADLWGQAPAVGSSQWCGSFRIYTKDGHSLAHADCPMAQCLKTGKGMHNVEIIVERPDGARRHVLVSPQPVLDDQGELIGAINTLTDVTQLSDVETASDAIFTLTTSILRHSEDCIKILDLDGLVQSVNPYGLQRLGFRSSQAVTGLSYFELWSGDQRSRARRAIDVARSEDTARFTADFIDDNGVVTKWDERVSLTRNASGVATGYLVISRDVTNELLEAEVKSRQLRQKQALAQLSALALRHECFDDFMATTVQLMADTLSVPMVKILAFADQADHLKLLAGVGWAEGLVGTAWVGVDLASQAGFTLIHDGPVIVDDLRSETRFSGPPLLHEHGVVSGMSVTIPGAGSRPFGVLGVHSDQLRSFDESEVDYMVAVANLIASGHRHNEAMTRQTLLVREVAHRAGNMLQFVSSIFSQTARASTSLDEARSKFQLRLSQMSRANILVSGDGWTKSNVRELVETALAPFHSMFDMEGREIMLPAELCFDLGLVLHELATNSAKYGAFRGGDGRVLVRWSLDEVDEGPQRFVLEWRDRQQPDKQPSYSTGFGTRLIQHLIESKWSGLVETTQEPHFVCRISLPMPSG